MRISVGTSGLLLACMCMLSPSSAQSQQPNYSVSVRELSIPPKALRAFKQGMGCMAKRDPAGSLPHFQLAVSEYSGYFEAYDRMGAAELKLWHVREAEQAFRKSIEVSSGQYAHPLLALGAILDDQKKFAEAITVIHNGLLLDPDSWTGHYYLGLALFGLNRMEEAENSIREALLRNVNFPRAHLLLADIHAREKDYQSLVADLDEYLRLAPDGPASGWAEALRDSIQRRIFESQGTSGLAQP